MKLFRTLRVAALLGAVGCGNGEGTGFVFSTSKTSVVGSAGDTLETASGIKMVIPPGALSSDLTIGIAESTSIPVAAPSGQEFVSNAVALTPHGTQFAKPVTLILPWARSGSGANDALRVLRLDDEKDTTWESYDVPPFDNGTTIWTTETFSVVAAAEEKNANAGQPTSVPGEYTTLSGGYFFTCGIKTDGTLHCWGDNRAGESEPPTGTFTSVSGGDRFACAIRTDKTVVCWGDDSQGQTKAPAGEFTQISASWMAHACGVKTDGTIACWGRNVEGQSTPPEGTFTSVTTGFFHTCGLKADQTVSCWGTAKSFGTLPTGKVQAVTAGGSHTCFLQLDGTISCGGDDFYLVYGQAAAPVGAFAKVKAGAYTTCAMKADGTMACWGAGDNITNPPKESFAFFDTGGLHACAIRENGSVVCWGHNMFGQAPPPKTPCDPNPCRFYAACTVSGATYTCAPFTCTAHAPTHGTVNGGTADVTIEGPMQASYACDAGYTLTGDAPYCTGIGLFSAEPTCAAITCTAHAPSNGTVNGGSADVTLAYSDIATYACNAGYALTGTANECTTSGPLTGEPTCTAIMCTAHAPNHGTVNAGTANVSIAYATAATYACDLGYGVSGTPPACGGSTNPGTLQGAEPVCNPVCTSPVCDVHANCVAPNTCQCQPPYVGNGATCALQTELDLSNAASTANVPYVMGNAAGYAFTVGSNISVTGAKVFGINFPMVSIDTAVTFQIFDTMNLSTDIANKTAMYAGGNAQVTFDTPVALTTGHTYAITVAPILAMDWNAHTPNAGYTTGVATITGVVTGTYMSTLTDNGFTGASTPAISILY